VLRPDCHRICAVSLTWDSDTGEMSGSLASHHRLPKKSFARTSPFNEEIRLSRSLEDVALATARAILQGCSSRFEHLIYTRGIQRQDPQSVTWLTSLLPIATLILS
jgi:hypothetical protein